MYKLSAELFKVLSDENRLQIIELLIKGETCGCNLVDKLPISQPTLSYHLKMLHEAGITTTERNGNKISHSVNKEVLTSLGKTLDYFIELEDDSCKV